VPAAQRAGDAWGYTTPNTATADGGSNGRPPFFPFFFFSLSLLFFFFYAFFRLRVFLLGYRPDLYILLPRGCRFRLGDAGAERLNIFLYILQNVSVCFFSRRFPNCPTSAKVSENWRENDFANVMSRDVYE